MGEYYAYTRTNFRGDPNISLPEDDQWDDTAKKDATFILFLFYTYKKHNFKCNLH